MSYNGEQEKAENINKDIVGPIINIFDFVLTKKGIKHTLFQMSVKGTFKKK